MTSREANVWRLPCHVYPSKRSRIVVLAAYDNQTAITLGRVGGKPRWHPTFLAFARHYGFEPAVGRPGHKERRGKVERPFPYLEHDFLAGRTFASWDDLQQQGRHWLDTVANVRVHGTTRRRVDEAFAEEQPCLITLPPVRYPAARQETRVVQHDGYIPVDGSYYPVPAPLVEQDAVTVRIDPRVVQILDAHEAVAASYPVPETPTRLLAPCRRRSPTPPPIATSTPARSSASCSAPIPPSSPSPPRAPSRPAPRPSAPSTTRIPAPHGTTP